MKYEVDDIIYGTTNHINDGLYYQDIIHNDDVIGVLISTSSNLLRYEEKFQCLTLRSEYLLELCLSLGGGFSDDCEDVGYTYTYFRCIEDFLTFKSESSNNH